MDDEPGRPLVRVFGQVTVANRGADHRNHQRHRAHRRQELAPASRLLLAHLVAAGPDGVSRDELLNRLFDGRADSNARAALRTAISRLRSKLAPDVIAATTGRVRIDGSVADVDAWLLTHAVQDPAGLLIEHVIVLLAGRPYPDIELSEPIRTGVALATTARTSLIDHLADHRADELTPADIGRVRSAVADADPDERQAVSLARLLLAIGDPAQALESIDRSSTLLGTIHVSTPGLETVRRHAARALHAQSTPASRLVPPSLLARRADPLLGREKLVARLVDSLAGSYPVAIVDGAGGSGKTALAAEVACSLAELGFRTEYLASTQQALVAYGPYLHGLPDLQPVLTRLLGSEGEPRAKQHQIWAGVVDRLVASVGSSSRLLVVDDAELLDDQSLELTEFLCRSAIPGALAILVVTGNSARQRSQPQASAVTETVPPLEPLDLEPVIAARFQQSSSIQRRGLAEDIVQVSGGRPREALRLLAAADPVNLLLPLTPEGRSVDVGVLGGLSDDQLDVAGALAVVGPAADASTVASMLGSSATEVVPVLDGLVVAGLVLPFDAEERWVLTSERVRSASLTHLTPERATQFHFRALRHATDPHQRAWHTEAIVSIVGPMNAARAAASSGIDHLADGNARQAVAAFERARELDASVFDTDGLIAHATALDHSGGDSRRARRRAVFAALAADDLTGALRAALSGLPEAAKPDGDGERVLLLEQLPWKRLGRVERLEYSLELSRQKIFVGNTDAARDWCTIADNLADEPDDQAQVWIVNCHVDGWTHDDQAPFEGDGSMLGIRGPTLARVRQAELSGALITGPLHRAEQRAMLLAQAASDVDDPIRQWYAQVLQAAVHEEAGDWVTATQVSSEAESFGLRWGVAPARATRLAQIAGRALLTGQLASVEQHVVGGAAEVVGSPLAQTVVACHLHEVGDHVRAEPLCRELITRMRNSRFLPAGIAVLANALPRYIDEATLDELRSVLVSRLGHRLVVGVGVVGLGPASRVLSKLSHGTERPRLSEQALEEADAYASPIWRIVTRLDLGIELQHDGLLAEAAAIAGETQLQALLRAE